MQMIFEYVVKVVWYLLTTPCVRTLVTCTASPIHKFVQNSPIFSISISAINESCKLF